jgi:hypothetical protein
MLVEWLQILRSITKRKIGFNYAPRLSIVLTAWDRVSDERKQESPQDYLDTEFPLLAQFVRSGVHGFDARVFGVSVVGGDLELDPEFYAEYLRSERSGVGYAVSQAHGGVERNPDVLMPIYWALGLET